MNGSWLGVRLLQSIATVSSLCVTRLFWGAGARNMFRTGIFTSICARTGNFSGSKSGRGPANAAAICESGSV